MAQLSAAKEECPEEKLSQDQSDKSEHKLSQKMSMAQLSANNPTNGTEKITQIQTQDSQTTPLQTPTDPLCAKILKIYSPLNQYHPQKLKMRTILKDMLKFKYLPK